MIFKILMHIFLLIKYHVMNIYLNKDIIFPYFFKSEIILNKQCLIYCTKTLGTYLIF